MTITRCVLLRIIENLRNELGCKLIPGDKKDEKHRAVCRGLLARDIARLYAYDLEAIRACSDDQYLEGGYEPTTLHNIETR